VPTGAGAVTVTVAWPVFPSLDACSEAVPAAWPNTLTEWPEALPITNTEGSVLDHVTVRLVRTLPAASRSSAAPGRRTDSRPS